MLMEKNAKEVFLKYRMMLMAAREKGDITSKLMVAQEEARQHQEEFDGCKRALHAALSEIDEHEKEMARERKRKAKEAKAAANKANAAAKKAAKAAAEPTSARATERASMVVAVVQTPPALAKPVIYHSANVTNPLFAL